MYLIVRSCQGRGRDKIRYRDIEIPATWLHYIPINSRPAYFDRLRANWEFVGEAEIREVIDLKNWCIFCGFCTYVYIFSASLLEKYLFSSPVI